MQSKLLNFYIELHLHFDGNIYVIQQFLTESNVSFKICSHEKFQFKHLMGAITVIRSPNACNYTEKLCFFRIKNCFIIHRFHLVVSVYYKLSNNPVDKSCEHHITLSKIFVQNSLFISSLASKIQQIHWSFVII